jgi:hypothetical protein
MRELAGQIGDFTLPLTTQFALCACPIDTRSGDHVRVWRQWVAAVAEEIPSPMPRGPVFSCGRQHDITDCAAECRRPGSADRRVSLDAPPDARAISGLRRSDGGRFGGESVHLEFVEEEERAPLPSLRQRTRGRAQASNLRSVFQDALRATRLEVH